MARISAAARSSCAALIACAIAACGGGGGGGGSTGGPPPAFSVSPTSLSFSAANANVATPLAQTVTATVNGVKAGTLFIRIVVTGNAVVAVDSPIITGPTMGQMTVRPAAPSALGPGNHASVITVTACTTDINCSGPQLSGSPVVINVAYQVGAVPPPPDAVAPSVGTAGIQDEVILRGNGFAAGTSVTFGGTPAVSSTVMSATEIRATYPATLAAGPHAVQLNGGAIPFTGSLHLVQPATLVSDTLAYPIPPQNVRGLAYDARRQALIVGAGFSTPLNNQVLRYEFASGAWQAPQDVTLPNLRNLILSLDGERLLAITDTTLAEINPATLGLVATRVRPTNSTTAADGHLKAIVAANDGQAFVVSGSPNFGQHWLYAIASRTFSIPFGTHFHPVAGGPDNGARAVFIQGGVSPAMAVQQYSASTGLVSATPLLLAHFHPVPGRVENINPPVFDRSGSRMLVAAFLGNVAHPVYDANFAELGRLPSGGITSNTAAYALAPDGSRAYILDIGTGVCRVRIFELSGPPPGPGVQFPETGVPINLLPNCPADRFDRPIRMLLNPPGSTLFIAGNELIRVVPLLP